MVKYICPQCKKEFRDYKSNHRKYCSCKCKNIAYKGHISWNKGKKGILHHSEKAKKKISIGLKKYLKFHPRRGKDNPPWRGGKTKNDGYVLLYTPSHPRGNKNYYVKRCHLIMEKHLGRYLKPKEIVHHINGIKDDDRLENLQLLSGHSAHIYFHQPWRFHYSKKI